MMLRLKIVEFLCGRASECLSDLDGGTLKGHLVGSRNSGRLARGLTLVSLVEDGKAAWTILPSLSQDAILHRKIIPWWKKESSGQWVARWRLKPGILCGCFCTSDFKFLHCCHLIIYYMHKVLFLKLPFLLYDPFKKGSGELEAHRNNLLKVNRFTVLKNGQRPMGCF